jgi:hypothetical protein
MAATSADTSVRIRRIPSRTSGAADRLSTDGEGRRQALDEAGSHQRFRDTIASTPLRAMDGEDSIRDGLDAFFGQIVEYTTADRSHLGCLRLTARHCLRIET